MLGVVLSGAAGQLILLAGLSGFVVGFALMIATALFGIPTGLVPRKLRGTRSLLG